MEEFRERGPSKRQGHFGRVGLSGAVVRTWIFRFFVATTWVCVSRPGRAHRWQPAPFVLVCVPFWSFATGPSSAVMPRPAFSFLPFFSSLSSFLYSPERGVLVPRVPVSAARPRPKQDSSPSCELFYTSEAADATM